jgi:hypothetical protein
MSSCQRLSLPQADHASVSQPGGLWLPSRPPRTGPPPPPRTPPPSSSSPLPPPAQIPLRKAGRKEHRIFLYSCLPQRQWKRSASQGDPDLACR